MYPLIGGHSTSASRGAASTRRSGGGRGTSARGRFVAWVTPGRLWALVGVASLLVILASELPLR